MPDSAVRCTRRRVRAAAARPRPAQRYRAATAAVHGSTLRRCSRNGYPRWGACASDPEVGFHFSFPWPPCCGYFSHWESAQLAGRRAKSNQIKSNQTSGGGKCISGGMYVCIVGTGRETHHSVADEWPRGERLSSPTAGRSLCSSLGRRRSKKGEHSAVTRSQAFALRSTDARLRRLPRRLWAVAAGDDLLVGSPLQLAFQPNEPGHTAPASPAASRLRPEACRFIHAVRGRAR